MSFVHQAYSNVYIHMQQLEIAHQHLNEAIKLANDIMQNWILLALLERKMGR